MQISMKCSVALHCLLFIYLYGKEVKVTSALLAKTTGINAVSIRNLLSAMKKDGIILIKSGTGGATLNCPPDQISLYRLGRVLEPHFLTHLFRIHPEPSTECPIGKNIVTILNNTYKGIQDGVKGLMEKATLQDVIDDYQRTIASQT